MTSTAHLAFTLFQRQGDQTYPMALAAAYASIRRRTSAPLHVHVVVDGSVEGSIRQKLASTVQGSDEISFHPVTARPEVAALAREFDGLFSPAIVWRIWIAELLHPLDRCLLLDCDLLFHLDVQRLWLLDLGENCLSAPLRGIPHSPELHDWLGVPAERYFRMTCCLMNLQRLRAESAFCSGREAFLNEARFRADQGLKQADLLEQSVFNRFFAEACRPLPVPVIPVDRLRGHLREEEWRAVLADRQDCILDTKGWQNRSPHAMEFWSSLLDTAWSDEAVKVFEERFRPPELSQPRR